MKMENKDILNSSYWTARATERRFTEREVPQELIAELVKKAAHAPTTGGMQLYSVIVTRKQEVKKELAAAHFNQPAATGNGIFLTFVADFNRFSQWCEQRGAKPGFENFESFTAAMLDAVIFAQQFNTLAELAGLGCVYLGTTTYTASRIGEILELPRLTVPVVTLAIGWPAVKSEGAERLPADALIHEEVYRSYDADDIDRIYSEKESLPANLAFVEENGKPSLAHVFTDVRYPEANAVKFSEDFFDYISRQGFAWPEKNAKK